jgi:hypothetical protein
MLKLSVAERVAVVAGLAAPKAPVRRCASVAIPLTVLTAVVALMGIYYTVREMARSGLSDTAAVEDIARIAPAAGPDRLMSLEEIKRRAGQE